MSASGGTGSAAAVARRASSSVPDGATVEIPVAYDGPDLAEVARLTGLAEDEVVAAHTATPWRGAVGGGAPGPPSLGGRAGGRRGAPRDEAPAEEGGHRFVKGELHLSDAGSARRGATESPLASITA